MITENSISVSVRKAAQILDASESFIRAEIRRGKIKAKNLGAKVSIAVKDLEAYHNGQPDWTPGEAPQAANDARRKAA